MFFPIFFIRFFIIRMSRLRFGYCKVERDEIYLRVWENVNWVTRT